MLTIITSSVQKVCHMNMNMNRTFFLRKEDAQPRWRVVDARDKVVGRIASEIADALTGKDQSSYTPHTDSGDYVVVINADKVKFTGDKFTDKEYVWHTGWMGGKKQWRADAMFERKPEFIIKHAVKGMMPKNKRGRQQLKKLRVYTGESHPHEAQVRGFPV